MYRVTVKRKIIRNLQKLPQVVRDQFNRLVNDLIKDGPVQPSWMNYSKLSDEKTYHCHLGYRYVACWRCENGTIEIEVYYVGSREKAPY